MDISGSLDLSFPDTSFSLAWAAAAHGNSSFLDELTFGGKPDLLVRHVLVEVGGVLDVAVHGDLLQKRVQKYLFMNKGLKRLQCSLFELDA